MINDWLNYEQTTPTPYVFQIINVSEKSQQTDEIKSFLSNEVLKSYRELEFLKFLYANEAEDKLKKYLEDYVFPSGINQLSKNVTQGDFGETLAYLIVSHFHELVVPIRKLRWKLNNEKSVFCTDMIGHNHGNIITNIHYFEIKSKIAIKKESVNGHSNYITVHAHNSLLKEEQTPNEGIADFLSRYFFSKGEYDNADKYGAIVKNPNSYDREFELVFIIETSKYIPDILEELENLPPQLNPLKVSIILIKDLLDLINHTREKAIDEAIKYVYGEGNE